MTEDLMDDLDDFPDDDRGDTVNLATVLARLTVEVAALKIRVHRIEERVNTLEARAMSTLRRKVTGLQARFYCPIHRDEAHVQGVAPTVEIFFILSVPHTTTGRYPMRHTPSRDGLATHTPARRLSDQPAPAPSSQG